MQVPNRSIIGHVFLNTTFRRWEQHFSNSINNNHTFENYDKKKEEGIF